MGGNKTQTSTIRYAPYLESLHQNLLAKVEQERNAVVDISPFYNYTEIEIEDAFFSSGYTLSSFPSLYDMYGKFLAGLDVETLFDQILEETVNGTVVDNMISAEADRLTDNLEQEALPRFEAGMRDINAVMSSSFIIGKSVMETARIKAIERFAAETRYRLVPVAAERWKAHLEWNRATVEMYAQVLKFYIAAKMDVDNHNLEIASKNALWPFSVMQYNVQALGALSNATTTTTDLPGTSKTVKAIGGTLTGAASGALTGMAIGSAGGPIGAAGGALIGGLIGLAGGLFS